MLWKQFDEIEQNYHIREHSSLPCDRDFNQIKKKRLMKFDRIYSMRRQLLEIIFSRSPKNPQQFTVKLSEAGEIQDFNIRREILSVETGENKAKKENKVWTLALAVFITSPTAVRLQEREGLTYRWWVYFSYIQHVEEYSVWISNSRSLHPQKKSL